MQNGYCFTYRLPRSVSLSRLPSRFIQNPFPSCFQSQSCSPWTWASSSTGPDEHRAPVLSQAPRLSLPVLFPQDSPSGTHTLPASLAWLSSTSRTPCQRMTASIPVWLKMPQAKCPAAPGSPSKVRTSRHFAESPFPAAWSGSSGERTFVEKDMIGTNPGSGGTQGVTAGHNSGHFCCHRREAAGTWGPRRGALESLCLMEVHTDEGLPWWKPDLYSADAMGNSGEGGKGP